MAIYNIDQLVSLRVYKEYPSTWYRLVSSKGLLGLGTQTHFVRTPLGDKSFDSIEDFLKEKGTTHTIIDGVICEKPCVNIRFSNNEEREIRFETVDEAWKYHDELKDKLKDRAIEI